MAEKCICCEAFREKSLSWRSLISTCGERPETRGTLSRGGCSQHGAASASRAWEPGRKPPREAAVCHAPLSSFGPREAGRAVGSGSIL